MTTRRRICPTPCPLPLRGAQAVMSVDEPLQAARALRGLPSATSGRPGRAGWSWSRTSPHARARYGRAALLEAWAERDGGPGGLGGPSSSAWPISTRQRPTRVDIGRCCSRRTTWRGAGGLDRWRARRPAGATIALALQTRLDLAIARYADAWSRRAPPGGGPAPLRGARPACAGAGGDGCTTLPGGPTCGALAPHVPRPGQHPRWSVRQRPATAPIRLFHPDAEHRGRVAAAGLHPVVATRRQEDIGAGCDQEDGSRRCAVSDRLHRPESGAARTTTR